MTFAWYFLCLCFFKRMANIYSVFLWKVRLSSILVQERTPLWLPWQIILVYCTYIWSQLLCLWKPYLILNGFSHEAYNTSFLYQLLPQRELTPLALKVMTLKWWLWTLCGTLCLFFLNLPKCLALSLTVDLLKVFLAAGRDFFWKVIFCCVF